MSKDKFITFAAIWQDLTENDPDKMICRIPTHESHKVLSYRVRAFLKLSSKIANAFNQLLKLERGTRIAFLTQSPDDYALILHGSWLANVVPVILSTDLSDHELIESIQHTNCSVVVFPPESSARIASLFNRVPKVSHWIASGKASFTGSGLVHRLEELIVRADFDFPEVAKAHSQDEDIDGLIVRTSGTAGDKKFVLFSQKALIMAGHAAMNLHPKDAADGSLVWCGLPLDQFNAIVHNCIVPLFSPCASYIKPEVNLREFWEFAFATDLTLAILSQQQLRTVHRRGKPRAWLKPEELSVGLYCADPLSMTLVTSFEDRYVTPVFSCYSITEAGGIVTMMPRDSSREYREEWFCDFDVPSSGIALSDTSVSIVSAGGDPLEEEELGTVLVETERCMKSYVGPSGDETRLLSPTTLITGDEGYWVKDEQGQAHLFVHGRSSEVIERNSGRISPVKANDMLLEIHGIEFARTLGFPNIVTGYEVGAYVVPLRAAQLTEDFVLSILRDKMGWDECPKVVIFGSRDDNGNLPTRDEMEAAFAEYFDIDFNLGRF